MYGTCKWKFTQYISTPLLWRSCRLILICFLGTALFLLETILILNPCPTNPKSCRCMVLVDSASSGTQSKIEWCISFIYQFQKDFIRSKDWILFFYHPSSYYICSYHVFKKSHLSTMYTWYTYICTLYIQVYYFYLAKIFNGQLFITGTCTCIFRVENSCLSLCIKTGHCNSHFIYQ